MAKKAKKAKRVVKSKKAKRAPAKRKASTVTVPMQSVVQFVRMLVKEGHDDAFEKHVKGGIVALSNKDVDIVKDFLARNGHVRPTMATAIREPCPGNPFEC
jgi:hypothetical protein